MLTQVEMNNLILYVKRNPDKNLYTDDIMRLLNNNHRRMRNIPVILLEFYTDYLNKLLSKDDVTNNTLYRFISAIITVIAWTSEKELEINEEIVIKIKRIERLYKEYINRTGKESSDDIGKLINIIIEIFGAEEMDNREIEELKDKIKELESTIKEKTIELENKKKKVSNLKLEIEDLNKHIKELNETIDNYLAEIECLKKENKGLSTYIESFNEEEKVRNKELLEIKKNILELKSNNDKLLAEIDRINNREKIEDILTERVIALLFHHSRSKEEIINCLKGEVTDDSFNYIINKAKEKVMIGNTSFNATPEYSIIAPPILENRIFNIDCNNKNYIDLLVTSDYHLNYGDDYYYFERKLDYCEDKGINLILNLGDVFGFKYGFTNAYNKYVEEKDLVNYVIDNFPRRNGIYHAILGGNHDKDSRKYGFDSIELLTKYRDDMFNLGYTDAVVTFNGIRNPLSSITLHHLDRRVKDPLFNEEYNEEEYKRYIDNYNKKIGMDGYAHLIGGSHIGGIYSNFILVNSFTNSRMVNSAMRLKVLLDENSNIRNMISIPIIVDDKAYEVTEMVYTKK